VLRQDLPRFESAIQSAIRLRNSIPVELGLLLFVYSFGLWFWHNRVGFDSSTWYANSGGRWNLTPAGFWYVFVSIPIVQFILLRWYLRLFIWFRFVWQVSRMGLHLSPTHPDRCAGLAFLGKSSYAFGPILFAQGTMLAGLVASRVLYRGESLASFKLQIAGFIAFFVLTILGPLLMFTPKMAQARRKGLADYGLFAQRYIEGFEQKWVLRDPSTSEGLLGAADIQSLSDLGTSYALVRDMRPVPFEAALFARQSRHEVRSRIVITAETSNHPTNRTLKLTPFSVSNTPIFNRAMIGCALYDGIRRFAVGAGQVAFFPIIDAIREFNAQTNDSSAAFGRFNGGVINLTTKSGSNAFHGTVFEFLWNEALNARNLFAPATAANPNKPEFRRKVCLDINRPSHGTS